MEMHAKEGECMTIAQQERIKMTAEQYLQLGENRWACIWNS